MVHRVIEHGGRNDVEPERGHDGVHLPMIAGGCYRGGTSGRVIAEARPAEAAPVAAQEIGGRAAFVKKGVLADVAERLPRAAASLFVGLRFLRVKPRRPMVRHSILRPAALARVNPSSTRAPSTPLPRSTTPRTEYR